MAKAPRVPGDQAKAPEAEVQRTDPAAGLAEAPNAIDVDPHAITSPVLTKQGWVCPADKPNPRAPA